jgi:hypothetical protein
MKLGRKRHLHCTVVLSSEDAEIFNCVSKGSGLLENLDSDMNMKQMEMLGSHDRWYMSTNVVIIVGSC